VTEDQPQFKRCNKCFELQPISAFYAQRRGALGVGSHCKGCRRAVGRATYLKAREVPGYRQQRSEYQRLYRYSLTGEQYEDMLASQNNACGICLVEFKDTPHIDHDHACCPGKKSCGACVRGLLCTGCNTRLGWLEKYRREAEAWLSGASARRVA
jgi:hypothetical protein